MINISQVNDLSYQLCSLSKDESKFSSEKAPSSDEETLETVTTYKSMDPKSIAQKEATQNG